MAHTNGVIDQYAEVFDEGHGQNRDGAHQRIRANSSIMQLKKLLGARPPHPPWASFEAGLELPGNYC